MIKELKQDVKLFLAFLAVFSIASSINIHWQEKALKNCIKNGYEYDACVVEVQK